MAPQGVYKLACVIAVYLSGNGNSMYLDKIKSRGFFDVHFAFQNVPGV